MCVDLNQSIEPNVHDTLRNRKLIRLAKLDKGYEDFDWLVGFWEGRILHGASKKDPEWHKVPDYLDSYDAILPLLQKQTPAIKFGVLITLAKDHYTWPDSSPEQIADALLTELDKRN